MPSIPTGTVTFLFTDIVNSTSLAREHPDSWEAARSRHHTILREAIERNNGYVFQVIGDAFCAAFHKAGEALKAAISTQQDLQNEPWDVITIYVRMGIHTGEAEFDGNEYRGYMELSFVQRLMSAGHGGQILVSHTTESLLQGHLPGQISLRDLSLQKFVGVPSPTQIFQVIAPDLPIEFPPLRTIDNLPNNLPLQLTSFVGREKELADVKRLLHSAHLLTLIGPGGTGKTRLSIRAANEALDQFPDGVWLVELAPILNPQLVPRTIAIAMGLRDEPQRPIIDMLCDYIHEKKMLLILDNCEHLVDACAFLADRILHTARHVRILASSREALGIGGEVTYRVPSLEVPDLSQLPPVESLSQYEAVKLFIDRATAAIQTFTVTNNNAPALAQICHHLDGIPLAIELAAAKLRVLSVDQIAERLDDRFRLLTGGSRTGLERHQTLHAAIDWSYNLLSPAEQVLFQRVSVFVGGWTLEAAESVCEGGLVESKDVLSLIEQLINKSLVIREEEVHQSRYRMLETIRQYAHEKQIEARENNDLRDRHLAYFLNLAETAEPHLMRPEQLKWLSRLQGDYENLRLAFEWSLNQKTAESSLKFCTALAWFWRIRCYWLEGLSWTKNALAKPPHGRSNTERMARARALATHALLEWQIGDFAAMLPPAQASLALALKVSERKDIAIARFYVGIALRMKDQEQAISLMDKSFAEFQALNEPLWQAFCFAYLGEMLTMKALLRDHDRAVKSFELARKAGERLILADVLSLNATSLFAINQLDEARELVEESESLYQQLGYSGPSENSFTVANIAWFEGDFQKARLLYQEMFERYNWLGEKVYKSFCLAALARLAMEQGDLRQAETFLKEEFVLGREIGFHSSMARSLIDLSYLHYLQENLKAFQQTVKEGLSLRNYFLELDKVYILANILPSLYIQKPESSARLLGLLDYFESEHGLVAGFQSKRACMRAEVHTRDTLGELAFETAFDEGHQMSLDAGLDLALQAVEDITEIKLPVSIDTKESGSSTSLPSQREVEKQKYGGLTSREREVAKQIAQGKSNQAIAAELSVGLKTVEAHVTHILSKLGFTSRAQIAGWAVAKGLAEASRDLDTLGRGD